MSTTNILDLNNRIDALEKKQDQDTTDYEQLSHLPKINSVELKGNKTSSDLGLANGTDIAPTFSDATGYSKGDLVYYDGDLYQFTADHAAGAWTGTDAQQKDLSDIVNGLTASEIAYDNTASGLTATDVQGAVDELRQADNIMLSDGVTSVEDAMDDVMPRTASGTTLATLNTALLALSDDQKSRATVCINGIYWMRRGLDAVFASSTYIGSTLIYQMQLQIGSTPHFYDISRNYSASTNTTTETTVTSWKLYYQGTPIS